MFIFVGCAGGGSSSLFCQRIVTAVNTTDPNLKATVTDVQTALHDPEAVLGNNDLLFAYGAIDALQLYNAFDFGQVFDVILVAPQVRYRTEEKRALMADYPTMLIDLPNDIFGKMDGVIAFDRLRGELLSLDWLRAYRSSLLPTGKSSDKDIEILVIGADHQDPQFTQVFEQWQTQLGIRTLRQTFTIVNLLQYRPLVDYEIRFLFGSFAQLDQKTLPNIERRIDGMIVVSERPEVSLKKLRSKMATARIPVLMVDDRDVRQSSRLANLNKALLDFMCLVQFQTEAATGATTVFKKKVKPVKKKTAFFGLVSWRVK